MTHRSSVTHLTILQTANHSDGDGLHRRLRDAHRPDDADDARDADDDDARRAVPRRAFRDDFGPLSVAREIEERLAKPGKLMGT